VDSGSTDETVLIAERLGAKVQVRSDWKGFGVQKNRALDMVTMPWVLSLDADERVSDELSAEIQSIDASRVGVAFSIPRLTQFCGEWINHCGWTPDRVVRIFQKGQASFSEDLVHERVVCSGHSIENLHGKLLHFSYPTPGHYWRKLEQYSQAWAEQKYAQGYKTSMLRAFLSGLAAFTRSYFFRFGFLDGGMGFAVCSMQGQAAFGKYFALYCLNRKNVSSPV
jgi:glycosyltransferase involved in cell wall biosynthesis